MAINVDPGYTQESTKSLSIPDLDVSQFAVVSKTANGTVVTNTTSPIDQPESIRWSAQNVKNVYSKTDIDPAYFATSKRGVSILSQVNDVIRVTDTNDNTFRVDLPVSAHIVVQTAVSNYLSSDLILATVLRAVASMFNEGEVTSDRLDQLIRGGTTPANL